MNTPNLNLKILIANLAASVKDERLKYRLMEDWEETSLQECSPLIRTLVRVVAQVFYDHQQDIDIFNLLLRAHGAPSTNMIIQRFEALYSHNQAQDKMIGELNLKLEAQAKTIATLQTQLEAGERAIT